MLYIQKFLTEILILIAILLSLIFIFKAMPLLQNGLVFSLQTL